MSENLNIIKQWNDIAKQWEGSGVEYIANDDGSNKFTPDEIKVMDNKIGSLSTDLGAHKAESATIKHKAKEIGLQDTGSNFSAVNVEGAMGELFTNVSNGKQLVGNAITGVDNSVVVPANPTFGNLGDAISKISTGKKWAGGETARSIQEYPFDTPEYGIQKYRILEVFGLNFKPSHIMVTVSHTSYVFYDIGMGTYPIIYFWSIGSSLANMYKNRFKEGSVLSVKKGSFVLPVPSGTDMLKWVAYE